MSCLTDAHMKEAFHVLRYLKATTEHGVLFAKDSTFQLRAFCDSDWSSYSNSRKSVTGYAILLGKSLISWRSKKQGIVSQSTAMVVTCCELTWLLTLLKDLDVQPPSPV